MVTKLEEKQQEVAQTIGEDKVGIEQPKWLEMMQQGVIVDLHIRRWRGRSSLSFDDLGLPRSTEDELYSYLMRLGDKKLLPMKEQAGKKISYVDLLDNLDSSARKWLVQKSYATHWGPFIPFTMYKEWKAGNLEWERKYYELRDEIVDNYPEITIRLKTEYNNMASVAYRRMIALRQYEGTETEFVTKFVDHIMSMVPSAERIYDSFSYDMEVRYIPLPTEIAEDLDKAERIKRALNIQDTQELAKLQALKEMNEDVIKQAAQRKTQLIDQFLTDVSKQLRGQIYDVCADVLESIQRNEGKLVGKSASQLANLVKNISALNFYGDQDIETMLGKIRSTLGDKSDDRNVSDVKTILRDVGILTRASLLSMGDNPRSARDFGIPSEPGEGLVRQARVTIGLDKDVTVPTLERTSREV